MAAVKQV
jgi:sperm-associated antigen 1